jgi:uncharacterized protein YdaU (DUF1376 family)
MPWVKWYVDDYLVATEHLSPAQEGAYVRLLAHCWRRGGWLPLRINVLARLVKMPEEEFSVAWRDALSELFVVSEDGSKIANPRMLEEVGKAAQRVEAGRERAAKRWADRTSTTRGTMRTAMRTALQPAMHGVMQERCTGDAGADAQIDAGAMGSQISDLRDQRSDPEKNRGECEGRAAASCDAAQAPLALVPADAPKRRRARREPTPESRAVGALMAGFAECWRAKYGATYRPDRRDASAVGRLLADVPREELATARERIDRYLADDSRWNVEEVRHACWHFVASWNKYAVSAVAPSDLERRNRAASLAWLASKEADEREREEAAARLAEDDELLMLGEASS